MENCPGPDCPPTTSTGKCSLHNRPKTAAERKRLSRQRQREGTVIIKESKTIADRVREYRKRKQLEDVSNTIDDNKRQKLMMEAEKKREYRKRKQLEDVSNTIDDNKRQKLIVEAGKKREYRKRKAGIVTEQPIEPVVSDTDTTPPMYRLATAEFSKRFTANPFGYACDICDRLWFRGDLKAVGPKVRPLLQREFPDENVDKFRACTTCFIYLYENKVPIMSRSNGFRYPDYPNHLPPLDCITERLISPRLPFLQIRRIKFHYSSKELLGQIINVPVDIDTMVRALPRSVDDDYAINVHIKKYQMYKTKWFEGYVKKGNVKLWLDYLLDKPLYEDITVDESFFVNKKKSRADREKLELLADTNDARENMSCQQRTMLWSEDKCLSLAPGTGKRPLGLAFDEHAEELSFPGIYLGEPRSFKPGVKATPFAMATSEIRRQDRRGATPEHVLYMAAKIMKLRVTESLYATFMEKCLDTNLSFLKSIPNSVHYWARRKKDLFAMIRQLGRPTMFLTLSACESSWPDLLHVLYRLRNNRDFEGSDILEELNSLARCTLVNEDPVTCCLYFEKLVRTLLLLLQSSRYSPFGKYRVLDYFQRIEFQHRGSPHAHILLWLENDPREPVGEDMPQTISLIEELITCDLRRWLSEFGVKLQRHKHTFTCYKKMKGKEVCRFGIPFWPMNETRVLIPMAKEDSRYGTLSNKYRVMKLALEAKWMDYTSLEEFLDVHRVASYDNYLNVLRAGIHRPMVFLKREISQVWNNPMNPWLANTLRSNMDIQFILDEFSCATYIADYVNKVERGLSSLHRDLVQLRTEYPDQDFMDSLRELGTRTLNAIEMSSQEAAWYLLRLGMSESSRKVEYVPTVWPQERQRVVKSHKQMDEEDLDENATDVWKDSIFERYSKRPPYMLDVCLADFLTSYYKQKKTNEYVKRDVPRVLRYRRYPMNDLENYKREMVTLYHPFVDEENDLLENNKYLEIYDDIERYILNKRKEYESDVDIDLTMKECRRLYDLERLTGQDDARETARKRLEDDKEIAAQLASADIDDIRKIALERTAIVKKRENVMSTDEYCAMMRRANPRQLDLVEEFIHRKWPGGSDEPIQIFFTGPAGSGKTFTMRLIMESCNRYSQGIANYNSYVATASTGISASAIDGVTVHSALRLGQGNSLTDSALSKESLNSLRVVFKDIDTIFVDECSMIGADMLTRMNGRLQQINFEYDKPFGGMNVILAGDLRQLPPVRQTPIFKRPKLSFNGEILWRTLQYYPLTEVMRQTDRAFSTALTKIGTGERLTDEERELIENRFVSESELTDSSAIRLFFKTADVDEYNKTSFGELAIEYFAIDDYSGYKNVKQLESTRNKIGKMKLDETGSLPRVIRLRLDKPYMLRCNIDVSDGLVNGAIGILKYVEREENRNVIRLWLQFPRGSKTGSLAKAKWSTYVKERPNFLNNRWVPICRKTIHISLKSEVRCRRTQFPLTEASAITVHKSQGATYDTVVYDYDKKHDQQLVYVALSRATSLDGLFLTNASNDKKFYHARGKSNEDLKKEYSRLEGQKLNTLADDCREFLASTNPRDLSLLVFNVQSLRKHKDDLDVHSLLKTTNLMALTETWLDNDEKVNISGYRCITQFKRDRVRAGGVAMYEKDDCMLFSTPHILMKFDKNLIGLKLGRSVAVSEECGDICAVQSTLNGQTCLLVTVYVSPNSSLDDMEFFLIVNLMMYTGKAAQMFEQIATRGYDKIPIILSGDYNIDLSNPKHTKFIEFMKETFDLELYSNRNISTTCGGSCLDAIFARNIDKIDTKYYISYFSYHRPMFAIARNDQESLLLPESEINV